MARSALTICALYAIFAVVYVWECDCCAQTENYKCMFVFVKFAKFHRIRAGSTQPASKISLTAFRLDFVQFANSLATRCFD